MSGSGYLANRYSEIQYTESDYARLRLASRTYLSKSFPIRPPSRDAGLPGRFITKVFEQQQEKRRNEPLRLDESQVILVNGSRRQIRALVSRDAGSIKEIKIQRVPKTGEIEDLLTLDREGAAKFIDFAQLLSVVPAEGENRVVLDDDVIRDLMADPEGLRRAYYADPSRFVSAIESDDSASDVIAFAARRRAVERFERLLSDDEFFENERSHTPGQSSEGVWQRLFEENPWILGVNLGGQLLTAWDNSKLEQAVVGASISGVGKRTDALMRSAGQLSLMVFAEIKHHRTPLLEGKAYRSGSWAPSRELAGGVVQIQQTVHRATRQWEERIYGMNDNGDENGEVTHIVRPRSYLVAGSTNELIVDGRSVNMDKIRSFELFRANTVEPQVITFDELLERARWSAGMIK